jgi:hypothetical protein
MRTAIRCRCGQRIVARDVLQRSWHVRVYGASFMYLRYRCSRCRRLGDECVDQETWDESLLREVPSEASREESHRFRRLGRITVDEQIEFHFALECPKALKALTEAGGHSEVGGRKAADA